MKKELIKKGLKLIGKCFTTRKGIMILSGTIVGIFIIEIITIITMIGTVFFKIKGISKKRKKARIKEKRRVLKECRLQYKKQLLNELESLDEEDECLKDRVDEIVLEINRLNKQFGI